MKGIQWGDLSSTIWEEEDWNVMVEILYGVVLLGLEEVRAQVPSASPKDLKPVLSKNYTRSSLIEY